MLLSRLCVESPEQRREKFRKMPSGSCSEPKDSVLWSIMSSGLDAELVSCVRALDDEGESNSSEPVQ